MKNFIVAVHSVKVGKWLALREFGGDFMKLRASLRLSTALIAVAFAAPSLAQTASVADSGTSQAANADSASAGDVSGAAPQSAAPGAAAPNTSDGVADIIVTAERRDSSVQRTAMNITAVSGDTLTAKGITNANDLGAAVPGLGMTTASPNNTIGLYGLAGGSANMWADPVMTLNYGGIPLTRQISAASAFYDLERIEVLKGPQGTLYGKNATVGALNLIPTKPTDRFEGNLSVTTGNYKTINTTGAVNVPITDTLATRFAFETTHHDGYLTSGYDDANNYGGRLSVQWKPNSDVSLLLWGDLYRNRAKGNSQTFAYYFSGQRWIHPGNPWHDLGPAGSCADQRYCPSLAGVDVGGINLQPNPAQGITGNGFLDTSPTGLARLSVVGSDGYDNANQNIVAGELNVNTGIGLFTLIAANVSSKIDFFSYSNGLIFKNLTTSNQNSVEARLSSRGDGPLKWVVGGFYYEEQQHALQQNLTIAGANLQWIPHLNDKNLAAFADLTLSVTDRFRLLGGLRYTRETKSQDGYTIASGLALTGPGSVAAITAAGLDCYLGSNSPGNYADVANTIDRGKYPVLADWHYPSNICFIPNSGRLVTNDVSWKAGFEFDVAPASLLYGTAKTGFRSGGFTSGTQNTYKPEKLTAFELGSKNRFFGNKLQVNLSGFYWDYKGQQLIMLQPYYFDGSPIGQVGYPTNIDGNLYGAEIDLQAALTHNDRLRFDGTWAKGKLDKTPFIVNSAGTTAPLTNVDRYNLPEWIFTAGYNHFFDLANGGVIDFGAQAHYESRTNMKLSAPNAVVSGDIRGGIALVDANVTYRTPDSKLEVQLFVKNLTNKAVVGPGNGGGAAAPSFFRPNTTSFTTANGVTSADIRGVTLNAPRTYGVRLSAHF